MATSKIQVTEGSGKNVATNSVSEDAVTKELQRVVLNNSAGVEGGLVNATVSGWVNVTVASPVTLSNTQVSIGNATVSVTGTATVSIGAVAVVTLSNTQVSISNLTTSVLGAVVSKPDKTNYDTIWKYSTVNTVSTAVWTPNTGSKCAITDILVSAAYAGSLTLADSDVSTGGTIMIFPLSANGGAAKQFRTPLISLTANNVMHARGSVTGMNILLTGYEV